MSASRLVLWRSRSFPLRRHRPAGTGGGALPELLSTLGLHPVSCPAPRCGPGARRRSACRARPALFDRSVSPTNKASPLNKQSPQPVRCKARGVRRPLTAKQLGSPLGHSPLCATNPPASLGLTTLSLLPARGLGGPLSPGVIESGDILPTGSRRSLPVRRARQLGSMWQLQHCCAATAGVPQR